MSRFTILFFSVGLERPQLHELHKKIVPVCAAKWEDLGKGIGLSPHELDIISENHSYHPRRSEECCKAVLKKWIEKDLDASWNKIETVIMHMGFLDVKGVTGRGKCITKNAHGLKMIPTYISECSDHILYNRNVPRKNIFANFAIFDAFVNVFSRIFSGYFVNGIIITFLTHVSHAIVVVIRNINMYNDR